MDSATRDAMREAVTWLACVLLAAGAFLALFLLTR